MLDRERLSICLLEAQSRLENTQLGEAKAVWGIKRTQAKTGRFNCEACIFSYEPKGIFWAQIRGFVQFSAKEENFGGCEYQSACCGYWLRGV